MLPFFRSLAVPAGVSLLSAAMLFSAACTPEFRPGPERTETRNIDLDNSQEVRVELKMAAGELRVHGGAAKLMEAHFVYHRLRLRPEVTYHSNDSRGELTVEEPGSIHSGANSYRWDLTFNDQKPLDLEVSCGAGETHLNLGDLTLRRVNVDMGVGQLRMDLRGEPKSDYDVSVNGGVGRATIYLPSNVGIEAEAEGGIGGIHVSGLEKRDGRWVNAALGHAKTRVRVDVHGGIGEIRLIAN
ncbi:MAG TPA: toast rack family protein [Bryobacteraceae bacterium]|nr:toast rack family protein [Bryobacteraceae bacterium]